MPKSLELDFQRWHRYSRSDERPQLPRKNVIMSMGKLLARTQGPRPESEEKMKIDIQ